MMRAVEVGDIRGLTVLGISPPLTIVLRQSGAN
jgi:hypothetical protein